MCLKKQNKDKKKIILRQRAKVTLESDDAKQKKKFASEAGGHLRSKR